MSYDPEPLVLSFKLAAVTTAILFVIGVPLAYWLAISRQRFRPVVEAMINLPLVLPPSVLGFYLLLAFTPARGLGHFLQSMFGIVLAFNFSGLVVASVIFSLPFMVQPLQSGFRSLPASLREAAYTLGLSELRTLLRILLPNLKPALLAAAVLSFAHTVGEFGVVLMVGGAVPGQTRVASIAIFDEVEALNYGAANFYALVLVAICFSVLLLVYMSNREADPRVLRKLPGA